MLSKSALFSSISLFSICSFLSADDFAHVPLNEPQMRLIPSGQMKKQTAELEKDSMRRQRSEGSTDSLQAQVTSLQAQVNELKQKPKDSPPFSIRADYLYLGAYEDGLEFVLDKGAYAQPPGMIGTDANILPALPGKVELLPPKWSSGFRVEMGTTIPSQQWDILLRFTWFKNSSNRSLVAADVFNNENLINELFFPIWINQGDGFSSYVTEASAKWKLRTYVWDLEFGKIFKPLNYLSFRPYAGAKFAQIDQNFDVTYGIEFTNGVLGEGPRDYINSKNDFVGGGFRLGIQPAWEFAENFSLVANGAFSLLFGYFNLHQDQTTNSPPDQTSFPSNYSMYNLSHKFNTTKQVIELSLGFKWESYFNADTAKAEIFVGWQQNLWLDQNQMFRFAASPFYNQLTLPPAPTFMGEMYHQHGDLTIQGLDVSFKVSF